MRRRVLAALTGLALAIAATACGSTDAASGGGSDSRQQVTIGYIAGPAPGMHLLLADEKGYFADAGLDVEIVPFQTGISLSNALTGGSIDVGVMGAVIANFPARGQGKVFLLNNLEANIQQIWAAPDSGIRSVADLRGKRVATTTGTAAHLLLHVALAENGLSTDDVEIVNLDMPAVSNTFVTGGVPAAALWAPFDAQIAQRLPGATKIGTSEQFYPASAIAGGWVANNEFHAEHRDALVKITEAWTKANDDITTDQAAALSTGCPRLSEFMTAEVCAQIYQQAKSFSTEEWAGYYEDGTAVDWIGRMERVFVEIGALPQFVEPAQFFDPSIFTDARQQP
ncbi:ABC transporter substrate-binding protein [Pseudonocardia kunmingensis]|uniref:NitT/TauT family transport system substrate-binding protein n=1 Tax=Pseudonocardia kunmingensis TaxID=630975 RepID=A0A543DPZ7_9PSEU|nr:ABC transporter substrate-binding protein [Pseudonocardia kunmingensis]TQM11406.1 NitT/TauT family transport system substrate-binding protein [Pseudonocardia kunmingensis]